jgi:DNA polymerase-3 subunit gamma/tau
MPTPIPASPASVAVVKASIGAPQSQPVSAAPVTGGDVPPWEDLPPEAMDGAPAGPIDADETAVDLPAHEVSEPVPVARQAVATREGELDWHGLIRELGLKGIVRELAQHCEWGGMADGQIRLTLGDTHKHLLHMNPANHERLQAELNRHFDQPMRLRIEVGTIEGETPAQRDAVIRQARHAEAVASLEQDPFVQEMIERFDATMQESSVRPL